MHKERKYGLNDFQSDEAIAALGEKPEEVSMWAEFVDWELAGRINSLRGRMIGVGIKEEQNIECAEELLTGVVRSWEEGVSPKTLRAKFRDGMKMYAKNNARKMWSEFFGNVYPNKTVIGWIVDSGEDGNHKKPALVMDGETPYGGFFNNQNLIRLAKKDPKLGGYMLSEALQIFREYSEIVTRNVSVGHLEACLIATRNFLQQVDGVDIKVMRNIAKETVLITEDFMNRRSMVNNHNGYGRDIMKGLELPQLLEDQQDTVAFLEDVIGRVLGRNDDRKEGESIEGGKNVTYVDTGLVYAPQIIAAILGQRK
ncbi:hypothetical protein ACFL1M_03535 [Patescibacteria group bacterium]